MGAVNLLRKGWTRSARYWQVLLALFLVNLLGGLLLAIIPALELLGPAHYTAVREAASGIPAWMASEILLNPVGNLSFQAGANSRAISSALQNGILSILIALGLLPGISWLPGCLVSGGLLLTYKESPEGFRWKCFLWGCWHYWGAYLLLGLLQTLLTLLVFILVITVFSITIGFIPWSAALLAPLAILLIVLWTGFMELAQVCLVVGENRSIGAALRAALSLLWRRFIPLTTYYILSLGLLLGLHLIFQFGLFPRLPLAFWPLVFVLQQSFIFLRLLTHAARLAGDFEFLGEQAVKEIGVSGPLKALTQADKEKEILATKEDVFEEGLQPLD
jgi:hypothetical protein